MSNINPSFNDESESRFSDLSLQSAMEETMFLVQHLEPKVRDLNRHYHDVLGAHPNSPDGNWVYLLKTENGKYVFAFHPISADRITLHCAQVGDHAVMIEEYTNDFGPESGEYTDLGPQIVGEVASLSYVPSTHVQVDRRS